MSAAATAALAPADAGSTATGPALVAALLGRIQNARSLLTLRFGSAPGPFLSVLLGIEIRSGWLLLDLPHPPPPRALIAPGTVVTATGRLDRGQFHFQCRVDGVIALAGGAALRVSVPTTIEHDDRRGGFRLALPSGSLHSPIQLATEVGRFAGRVLDLSMAGAAALVTGKPPIGSSVLCTLDLPQLRLYTGAEVRSQASVPGGHRLGLQFAPLSSEQAGRMSAALTALQRRLIRTMGRV